MYEKVNPMHPDKIADRIAGAMVDMAYKMQEDPKVAIEVLIGHGRCLIITESSVKFDLAEVEAAVHRISGVDNLNLELRENKQDAILAKNQEEGFRCGDNGIFRGCRISEEQQLLTNTARWIYEKVPQDGKYLVHGGKTIICQSGDELETFKELSNRFFSLVGYYLNPLGKWTGGIDTDTGATNRKIGSDMGDAVTGGGLHGKDLSKADVSMNIFLHMLTNEKMPGSAEATEASCAIGDKDVHINIILPEPGNLNVPYSYVVERAREYIKQVGGFEKFAEWGLIRPEE